ncbi:class I SAM-dependent methyltransferase [Oscillatoriales cyanobacterium LEGE 11467]|uniref:Class I SAM-dependent methyltransferase n=1 Tax=Zarconia navalis LEGE 11467 TaxID=1828826 RepID=A0A928W0F1_9CYAN|nr:class I SAM-dependent methyltransferase [Zarconia navalis]MBE9042603.1 class I SAM-dependent methyltransferase [Zarconia navalis LEGE 11467]
MTSNPSLCQFIDRHIQQSAQRRITFAEYMNWVLYHPQYGYYNGKGKLGAPGDFVTSVHLCSDFGETLAEQFFQMWQVLGCPKPFHLMEMGAGQGILAGDILTYIQQKHLDFFDAIEYIIVEKSSALKKEQEQRLKRQFQTISIRWCEWEEIPPNSIIGCCFSNELVDAFPVHQFVVNGGKLQEIYVTTSSEISEKTEENGAQFSESIGELSTPKIDRYFQTMGIDLSTYPDGFRSEVNLAALDWIETVAGRLQRGYLLTIDYGHNARRYYSLGRSSGTLQCYYQHRYHDNPYINVGHQDITAHVNFTALEQQGEQCGLSTVGFTQQGLFLMALGWGERLSTLGRQDASGDGRTATARDIATIMQRRQVLHSLIDPMGLGGFGVLVQSRGLSETEKGQMLTGLTEPTGSMTSG